jgi:hypothetical protein
MLHVEKDSPTSAAAAAAAAEFANLGFTDDPDAIPPPHYHASQITTGRQTVFEDIGLAACSEPRSPTTAGDESNLLLPPASEGSHTLPKAGPRKHMTQHRVLPMTPEAEAYAGKKKGIALL